MTKEQDAARAQNRRKLEQALSELTDLQNVLADAMARLPAVLGRVEKIRAELSGLLPRTAPAEPSSDRQSELAVPDEAAA